MLPIPMYERVLVRRYEYEKVTAGGIVIPEKSQAQKSQQQKTGVVLAIGPGYRTHGGRLVPLRIRVGDIIYFSPFAGVEIPYEEESLVLMREDEILGIKEEAHQHG